MPSHRSRAASIFVAAAFVGAIAIAAPTARAFQRRVHASVCIADRVAHDDIASNINGLTNVAAVARAVQCQVPDDTNALKQTIVGVRIHGFDGNNTQGVTAWACATNWSVPGGSCGASADSGAAFVGNYSLSPGLTEWALVANAADYIYLHVQLPATTNTPSTLRGFFLTN